MARETMAAIMSGVEIMPDNRPKLVAKNTVSYVRPDGATAVRFHHTDVVVTSRDKRTITLFTGGWKTSTTKDRINRFAPVRIFSMKGQWWLADGVPFYDGIKIRDGRLPKPRLNVAKKNDALGKKIIAFAKLVYDREKFPEIPKPEGGDCWCCSMFDQEKARDPDAMFGASTVTAPPTNTHDTSHLLEHLREGYLHGWLILNAMRWVGYKDVRLAMCYQYDSPGSDNSRETIARALRRYLRHRLGLST